MIDAKDLRIGDIVRTLDENGNLKTCKVTGIDAETCHNSKTRGFLIGAVKLRPFDLPDDEPSDAKWCKDVDPINLTCDILKKNGFENRYKGLYVKEYAKGRFLSVEYGYDNGCRTFLKQQTSTSYVRIGNTNYVHQLQHCLWLLCLDAKMEV